MTYLTKILNSRVYEIAQETRLDPAPVLSGRLKNSIFVKREDRQQVFSFKLRGAYNKIALLSEEVRAKGVIAASAGNHAQGVALAASKFSIKSLIVMPSGSPAIKVKAVKRLGGEVVLAGDTYQEAYEHSLILQKERGLTFIHPYDDPEVIAGQGTIGLEILRQAPRDLDYIFVPIGGGGLISGVLEAVKSLSDRVKVIGVEPVEAASMYYSLKAGHPVVLDKVNTFADGVATKTVGKETFRICSEKLDDIILVDTDAICAAVKDAFEEYRVILEPSGALSIAGLKAYCEQHQLVDQKMVAIASGANINFNRLRHIAERADYGENWEAVFAVQLQEKPGSFRQFCSILSNFNITEFNYRYDTDRAANVYVGLEIGSKKQRKEVVDILEQNSFAVHDLSNNEVAKLHIRHMVGGKSRLIRGEIIVSFVFQEKKGALLNFLQRIAPNWNLSLFHYRSHGSDVARVLVGFQIPVDEHKKFEEFLGSGDFEYKIETENPACSIFL